MSDNDKFPVDDDVIRPRLNIPVVNQAPAPAEPVPAPTPVATPEQPGGEPTLAEPAPPPPPPAEEAPAAVAEEKEAPAASGEEVDAVEMVTTKEDLEIDDDAISYPADIIDFRGEDLMHLVNVMDETEKVLGASVISARIRTPGTWENIMFRAVTEMNSEEMRIQDFLGKLTEEERKALSSRLRDEDGKTLLRIAPIQTKSANAGEVKTLSGEEAFLAFENFASKTPGGYRVPLYNSGITVDVIVPTGINLQTLLTNCIQLERELGSVQGAHYFTHADHMFKAQIVSFLWPLITNSSYTDWRKTGKLWSIIKLPDLQVLLMAVAAICYKDGFPGFVTKCTNKGTPEKPLPCGHTETITANLFDMIVTRWSVMPKTAVDFMVQARMGRQRNNLKEIAQYQTDLGLEGDRITFDDITLVMRIPTVAEHLDAGATFLAEIINEIAADNAQGRYEQVGFRYVRTFLPWISSIEMVGEDGEGLRTSEPRVIVRWLERLDDRDSEKLREALRHYVDKSQLTYVGYPVTPCPSCGYTADTPSGMWTFDPFSAFFTLAFRYLKPDM